MWCDYIIVHETGHEWFGNNITTADIADMWVHEGFTTYSETLFVEFHKGKQAGATYCRGERKSIANDKPIIGPYGVNEEGSGDMYYKGANLIHTIRTIVDNDTLFRDMLREMNQTFYHQIVTSAQIEQFMSQKLKLDLSVIFDQYLRQTNPPTLLIKEKGNRVFYRWDNCIPNFSMPLCTDKEKFSLSTEWTELPNGIALNTNQYYLKNLQKKQRKK
jgi:aminopeptidase N